MDNKNTTEPLVPKFNLKELFDEFKETREENPIKVRTLDTVKPEHIEWLWYPYIPQGKITIIQGAPDSGKTMFSCQLVADLSTGKEFLNEEDPTTFIPKYPREPMNILYQNAEDDYDDTIVPRLDAAGADRSRIFNYDELRTVDVDSNGERISICFEKPDIIERIIKENNIQVAVFDPLMYYIGTKADTNSANSVRDRMNNMINIAQRTGCTFIIIAHTVKQENRSAINKLTGSIDFVASVRSLLTLGRHPDVPETKALAITKSNLAKKEGKTTLLFRITYDDSITTSNAGLISFKGMSDLSADAILSTSRDKVKDTPLLDEAKDFITGYFGNEVSVDAQQIVKDAADIGITKTTLYKARKELGIHSQQLGGGKAGKYYWVKQNYELYEGSFSNNTDSDAEEKPNENPVF